MGGTETSPTGPPAALARKPPWKPRRLLAYQSANVSRNAAHALRSITTSMTQLIAMTIPNAGHGSSRKTVAAREHLDKPITILPAQTKRQPREQFVEGLLARHRRLAISYTVAMFAYSDRQVTTSARPDGVLVLGNYRQTEAIVHSLASAGLEVVVVNDRTDGKREFIELSKYVADVWHIPYDGDEELYCGALLRRLKDSGSVRYVFPVGERELKVLARQAARFRGLAELVMPDPRTAQFCLDKRLVCERAAALGVPTPPSATGDRRREWMRLATGWGLPALCKRKDSFELIHGRKALIIRTAEELDSLVRSLENEPEPGSFVLQKYVKGELYGCNITAVNGTITAFMLNKTARTDAPDGTGIPVEISIVAPFEDMRRYCELLMADLRYTGVCLIQFLRESRDSAPYLLEINPRLGASCALPKLAGYDFPRMALRCATYRGVGPLPGSDVDPAYPVGLRACSIYSDIFGLNQNIRRSPLSCSLTWLARLLRSLLSTRHHLTWRLDDPLPGLYLLYSFAAAYATGAWRRLMPHKSEPRAVARLGP